MPQRERDLFGQIANFQSLIGATRRAALGKRKKPGAAAFLADMETECLRLERTLRDGSYRPGRYVKIELFDPKHRIVSAAPFWDRVVHHALCKVFRYFPAIDHGALKRDLRRRIACAPCGTKDRAGDD